MGPAVRVGAFRTGSAVGPQGAQAPRDVADLEARVEAVRHPLARPEHPGAPGRDPVDAGEVQPSISQMPLTSSWTGEQAHRMAPSPETSPSSSSPYSSSP